MFPASYNEVIEHPNGNSRTNLSKQMTLKAKHIFRYSLVLTLVLLFIARAKSEPMISVSGMSLGMKRCEVFEIMGPPSRKKSQMSLSIFIWGEESPQIAVVFEGEKIISIAGSNLNIYGDKFREGCTIEEIEKILGRPASVEVVRVYQLSKCRIEIVEERGLAKGFFLRRKDKKQETWSLLLTPWRMLNSRDSNFQNSR